MNSGAKTVSRLIADPSEMMILHVIRTSFSVGGASRGVGAQDVRYIAIEYMEVRRDYFRFARPQIKIAARRASHMLMNRKGVF
jgi:hypothetical protein